jgi:hypothetical protein
MRMRGKVLCTVAGFVLGALSIMLLRPAGGVRPPAPERITEAELALDRPVGELDFDNTPLEQAIATLEQRSGTPIVVDWADLEPKGLKRTQPVTLRAREIPLGEALDRILQPLDTFPDGSVTYSAETGKVVVGTAERVASNLIVRIYDVRDLLGPETPPNPPTTLPASAVPNLCWFGKGPQPTTVTGTTPTDYERRARSLSTLLQSEVDSESWDRPAGNGTRDMPSISAFGGRLIVAQNAPAHRQVRRLLRTLRDVTQPDARAAAKPAMLWNSAAGEWVFNDDWAAEAGLLRVIPELRLDGVSFDQAVSILSQHARVPILVRRDVLRESWLADIPVELRLRDVPVYRALEVVLQSQNAGYHGGEGPGYGVDRGMIVISTRFAASQMLVTRAYSLRHWLWQDLFRPNPNRTHVEAQLLVTNAITDMIASDSWRDNGGYGSLTFFDDLLIVRQAWPNQEKLRRFMLDLQDAAARPSTEPTTLRAQ